VVVVVTRELLAVAVSARLVRVLVTLLRGMDADDLGHHGGGVDNVHVAVDVLVQDIAAVRRRCGCRSGDAGGSGS